MEEEDFPLNSAREIGPCSAPGRAAAPFALLYLQQPGSSEEESPMQLYTFCTPCLSLSQLAGAFLTLSSVVSDFQPSCGPLTLRLKDVEGEQVAVLLHPDDNKRCMVLALPVGLEEALTPLSMQLRAFLLSLRGSLETAFKDRERLDALCRRIVALVRPEPTWEFLQLLEPTTPFCPMQEMVRAKLQGLAVQLEAGFEAQPRPIATCAFLGTSLLFSHLSAEQMEFVLQFLRFHVFHTKRRTRELLHERFKAQGESLALQVVTSGELSLCALFTTAEEEPAVEVAHQLRACLKEMDNVIGAQASPEHPLCMALDSFLQPAARAKPEGLLSWIRGPPSPKAFHAPPPGGPAGGPLAVLLLHSGGKAALFLPPCSAEEPALRSDLEQRLLASWLALRPQLQRDAAKDPLGVAEAAVLTRLTAGEQVLRVWLVGRCEAKREAFVAFPETGGALQQTLSACEPALFGCGLPA